MALSESVINFNYQKAIEKAGELERAATQLQSSAKEDLGMIVSAIKKDWEGMNSTEFVAKCKSEEREIEATIAQMKAVAATIRSMAKRIYDAEMRALAIAREAERRAREAEAARAREAEATRV